ncbi:hypothetical protein CARUB_v10028091mg [Capsella rubella]|uniref:FBD domain-containing protein n=1 Tax=Capsella rubella TaxID=81985 RepID=R0F0J8_9BRAS|nr:hypothetical protein CARUB_v10028091mg [Capsella rubella]
MDLDRISALSDSLLTHILSYLLIEDSIKTSVLSKRWEFLWLKVPVMDLTTVKISLRGEAMSWLMRRFLELNRGSSLQRFNIKLYFYEIKQEFQRRPYRYRSNSEHVLPRKRKQIDVSEGVKEITFLDFSQEKKRVRYIDSIDGNNGVMDLISEVIHRGVQHLEADMCETMQQGGVISLMPKYLYVSKTLVSLKLVNVGLENPRFVASLPNLKMMHLKNIYYKNQYGLLIIKMLILASPLLEDLTFDFPELEKSEKNDSRQEFQGGPYRYRPNCEFIFPRKRKQIDFWRNFSDSPMLGETDDDLTNVPLCLISTLEYVKINRLVMKEENGLKLVNYFLENSVVLKKLTLSFTHSSVTNQQLESYKKLITSTKLSPTCQVIFD